MKSVMTQGSGRLLELLSLLQARRDWPGGELAERLGVSGRTIRRDVERLRGLGYPVDSLTGPAGGYRLRAGTAMPPLLLDDQEAIAIAVGLRTAARASVTGIEETAVRALVKLEQVLPAHLRRRVGALGSARWYLLAWDRGRDNWRSFRVDRLSRPASTGVRFTARGLPAKDPAAYVQASIAGAPNRYEARLTVRAPADEVASRVPAYWGTVRPIDAHTCEYRTGDDDLAWLALRIAMLGVDFEVHEPPELVEHLRALAARLERAT
jgi:predicted DNA-binding transcriptional regulator YafY